MNHYATDILVGTCFKNIKPKSFKMNAKIFRFSFRNYRCLARTRNYNQKSRDPSTWRYRTNLKYLNPITLAVWY